jgi:hypothetical protein
LLATARSLAATLAGAARGSLLAGLPALLLAGLTRATALVCLALGAPDEFSNPVGSTRVLGVVGTASALTVVAGARATHRFSHAVDLALHALSTGGTAR